MRPEKETRSGKQKLRFACGTKFVAQNDLIEAIDTAGQLRQQGIDSAKENITKLSHLSEEMRQKAGALKEPEKSVEA